MGASDALSDINSFRLRLFSQRVLFGLGVATLVAIAEASLYLIWQSRRSDSTEKRAKRRMLASARQKKDDGPDVCDTPEGANPTFVSTDEGTKGLRRRH